MPSRKVLFLCYSSLTQSIPYIYFNPTNLIYVLPIHLPSDHVERDSYKCVLEEVDARVSPVIEGCVDGTKDPWEHLRDQPRVAVSFRVLSEHLVILIVIPPEPSTWTQQQQSQNILTDIKQIQIKPVGRPTFEEVNSISFSGPHMHKRIHSIHGDPPPAGLQGHWVSIACAVTLVIIQPVPAVPHEVRVKADDRLSIGGLLLSDPIKSCVESALTAPWVQTQTQYGTYTGFVSMLSV